MTFRHIGDIKKGDKRGSSTWSGAEEAYMLIERGSATEVVAEMDIDYDVVEFMEKTFPKAFVLLKDLAESQAAKTVRIEASVAADIETVWKC